MDTSLFFLINKGLQNSFFDLTMPFITSKPYLLFFLVITPFFLKDWKKCSLVIILCLIVLGIGDASSNFFKHLFERERPCQALEGIRLLVGCGGSFSMPSSHSVNTFSVAAAFSHFFRRAAIPMFFIAILVAFSRIYVGVHYPSDVLAGIIWGGITAGVILFIHKWFSEKIKRPADEEGR